MRRREFIGLLVATVASWPFIALAQPPKRPLVAVILGSSQAASERFRSELPQGLKEVGYIEGRDYEIEYRYADGDLTRLPTLADEVVRLKPNVIVVGHTLAALAARQDIIANCTFGSPAARKMPIRVVCGTISLMLCSVQQPSRYELYVASHSFRNPVF